jgi:hypothetical protein
VSIRILSQSRPCWKRSKLDIGNDIGFLETADKFDHIFLSHVDSAQAYRNEVEVGEAVKESGIDREYIFISEYLIFCYGPMGLDRHPQLRDSLNFLSVVPYSVPYDHNAQ